MPSNFSENKELDQQASTQNLLNQTAPAIIILAAGGSRRLGHPKQLVELAGKTLLARACEQALQLSAKVYVVLGFNASEISASVEHLAVETLYNPNWSQGMASSIHIGVSAAGDRIADDGAADDSAAVDSSVMIMLCDQPNIELTHYQELIRLHRAEPDKIIASVYPGSGNSSGAVPAIFPAGFHNGLLRLFGDCGARILMAQYPENTRLLPCAEGLIDLDTPEDLAKLQLLHNSLDNN